MQVSYVLDACAMIATINNEDGSSVVANLYEEANAGKINLFVNKSTYLKYTTAIGEKGALIMQT